MARTQHQAWHGKLIVAPGLALFRGDAGDNRLHQHWVHQCIVSHTAFEVHLEEGSLRTQAALIKSQTMHQVVGKQLSSLFVDPTHVLAKALQQEFGEQKPTQEDRSQLARRLKNIFDTVVIQDAQSLQQADYTTSALTTQLQNLLGVEVQHDHSQDRYLHALHYIRSEIEHGDLSLSQLARHFHLSESRFSHWFKQQSGIALRSYIKWQRLIAAVDALQSGLSFVEAANQAGFTDQAHFNKTFVAHFGIVPSQFLMT